MIGLGSFSNEECEHRIGYKIYTGPGDDFRVGHRGLGVITGNNFHFFFSLVKRVGLIKEYYLNSLERATTLR